MFLKSFLAYILIALGLVVIGFSALAGCGALMEEEAGLVLPALVFIGGVLLVFAGWALQDSVRRGR